MCETFLRIDTAFEYIAMASSDEESVSSTSSSSDSSGSDDNYTISDNYYCGYVGEPE